MRHALTVRPVQSIGHRDGQLQRLLKLERAPGQPLGKRFALDVLGDKKASGDRRLVAGRGFAAARPCIQDWQRFFLLPLDASAGSA